MLTGMKTLAASVLAAFTLLAAPQAHADPASAVGDGPGPLAGMVCSTLDNDPSVAGVRRMMINFTGFMVVRQAAWDTILNGVVWECDGHAEQLRQYAAFYGNH